MQNLNSRLDVDTIGFQKSVISRLKLYNFAKSAIDSYCNDKASKLNGYNFNEFKSKFKLVNFKTDKEIKDITYKEIIDVGNNFLENELADSIFVLNMSTFENWVLTTLKLHFIENHNAIFQKSDKKIDISTIVESNDLNELWGKIIDEYLKNLPYSGMKKTLIDFLKIFNIKREKFTPNIIDRIHENSLCRNIIVHNQKKVNRIYVEKCGKFARYKEGEVIKITEDILYEQGDNLLKFMQDFRKNIRP